MSETLSIVNLGSGSKGNATVVFTRHGGLLIDCGFSRKELLRRLDEAQIPHDLIHAVLLTHEHSDHLRGIRLACETFRAPLYMTAETWRWAKANGAELPPDVRRFEPGGKFEIDKMSVHPFRIQHDAVDPVAVVIHYFGAKVGVATDLGAVNHLAAERLKGCQALLLESNYDLAMLRNSNRPIHLKRRIMGSHGHLDNRDAAAALRELAAEQTRYLILGHLSSECNHPDLVEDLFLQTLAEMKREDILLQITTQISSSPLLSIQADLLL